MDETLGKRIVSNRKRLGITQDRLAEQLGVTAQAVSKWENDQSCPDITMLPKLAEIFGISVDALLGLAAPEPTYEAEVITTEEPKEDGKHNWEVRWEAGRKDSIGLAAWVLLVGGLMLCNIILRWNVELWDIIWPSAVMMFGLFGLYPKFSFFRVGCSLFGSYFLLENLGLTNLGLSGELILPVVVILFGLSLLMDAVRKPKKPHFSVVHNGAVKKKSSSCNLGEDTFECSCAFGENTYAIDLPRLRSGSSDVSFGDLTVDLTVCGEFCPDCRIDADCAFGEMTILVPGHIRAEVDADTSFGSVDIRGNHDPDASGVIRIDADVSFGQITVKYI